VLEKRAVVELHYDYGTLVIPDAREEGLAAFMTWDDRTRVYRAPAERYRDVVMYLHTNKIPFTDHARKFERLPLAPKTAIEPFPHQKRALAAWAAAGGRGIVELPTGAGKTVLAVLAIAHAERPTLVVVPTIELLLQWQRVLSEHFDEPVGIIGGGSNDRKRITVITYDSAALQADFLGNQFGLLVCDECHHLPAPGYRFIAAGSIAPYRLGLTATLQRPDGGERLCEELLGPSCYAETIDALEGRYLAPYDVERVDVELTPEEQATYEAERQIYLSFLRSQAIDFDQQGGWAQFVMRCHRSEEGRRAFRAYRTQRQIAFASESKLEALWRVILKHRDERILVFTHENEIVYRLSHQLLLPVITHHTKVPERKRLLAGFAAGELPVLLTSNVLNEGVDVPDANVGVVLSGTGSVREHVQRLGRILRKRPGKRAVLYEICANVWAESGVSERRRQHRAYERGG